MVVYREVSDWKGRCADLLEALRAIACDSNKHERVAIARRAIRNFENRT